MIKMYHPAGRLRDKDGNAFDWVFPELLKDPTLPPTVFPRHTPTELDYWYAECRHCDRYSLDSNETWQCLD